jgi:hypothetical protein
LEISLKLKAAIYQIKGFSFKSTGNTKRSQYNKIYFKREYAITVATDFLYLKILNNAIFTYFP